MSWPGCSASGPCCPYPEMEQYTTEGFTRRTLSSSKPRPRTTRSEEHTSELQSPCNLVCRLLLEKKKIQVNHPIDAHVKTDRQTDEETSERPMRATHQKQLLRQITTRDHESIVLTIHAQDYKAIT